MGVGRGGARWGLWGCRCRGWEGPCCGGEGCGGAAVGGGGEPFAVPFYAQQRKGAGKAGKFHCGRFYVVGAPALCANEMPQTTRCARTTEVNGRVVVFNNVDPQTVQVNAEYTVQGRPEPEPGGSNPRDDTAERPVNVAGNRQP